ncbi:MAG: hypothetical protein IPK92_15875 [Nitrospira sp.]|nr:hypothetical protein [Nitrospira sp.]
MSDTLRTRGRKFYDGDTVEDKNIRRQQFCEAEIGRNKADSLAFRFIWRGMDIIANPTHLTKDTMHPITKYDTSTILLAASIMPTRAVYSTPTFRGNTRNQFPVWWIDGGCIRTQGQILIGNTQRIEQLKAGFPLLVSSPPPVTGAPAPGIAQKQADERPGGVNRVLNTPSPTAILTINGIVGSLHGRLSLTPARHERSSAHCYLY